MKIQTGVSVERFLNDIAIELTGMAYDKLLTADHDMAAEVKAEAINNTYEWERILYFN